jgi:hypothetical protein
MTWVFNPLDWCIREPRMEPRMARMRGVRAPHRRTAHTAHPPVRGCAVGCAVGGATLGPPAQRCPASGGGGWSATNGEPQPGRRTTRSCPLTWGCHVIRRERPQPFPGTSTPTPAALRAPAGRSRPPTGRCDDGLSRHPQDPDRPLQGLVAAGRRQPRQPDLRHRRPGPRLQARPARRLAHGSWVDPQLGRQTFETLGARVVGRLVRQSPPQPQDTPSRSGAPAAAPASARAIRRPGETWLAASAAARAREARRIAREERRTRTMAA